MTHCIIWCQDESHWEANLDAIPRVGETLQIEDEDDILTSFLIESVTHCLVRKGGRWQQIVDLYVKECDRTRQISMPW